MRTAVVAVAAGLAGACGGEAGGLRVVDPYAAEPVTTETAAIYFQVDNPHELPDTLLGAESTLAARASVHAQRSAGGLMHMHAVSSVAVPAGGVLQLRPGGLHLMLEGLTAMPRAGDTIEVTLRFARAGTVRVRVPVIPYEEVGERAAGGGEDRE